MSCLSLFSNVMTKCPRADLIFFSIFKIRPWHDLICSSLKLGNSFFNFFFFQIATLEILNNEGPLTISKDLFTVNLAELRLSKGGTMSKTCIFNELSLSWLNNSAIALMKATFSLLSWLSLFTLCLNMITQVHYATHVLDVTNQVFHQVFLVLYFLVVRTINKQ